MIREIIPNVSYKLPWDKLFQINLTTYYQRNHCKHYLVTIIIESFEISLLNYYQRIIANNIHIQLLSEKSFQTNLTSYCKRNHCKQYLQTIIREIIENNTYKLLPEKSLQTMLTKVYEIIQFILNNTSYFKHIIQTILLKLLSEN